MCGGRDDLGAPVWGGGRGQETACKLKVCHRPPTLLPAAARGPSPSCPFPPVGKPRVQSGVLKFLSLLAVVDSLGEKERTGVRGSERAGWPWGSQGVPLARPPLARAPFSTVQTPCSVLRPLPQWSASGGPQSKRVCKGISQGVFWLGSLFQFTCM